MDPFYTYSNIAGILDPSITKTQGCGDTPSGWLWFELRGNSLEPTEVGPMPYGLLCQMISDLQTMTFESLPDEVQELLISNGTELLFIACYDEGDSSVGIPSHYDIQIEWATENGVHKPVSRRATVVEEPEIEPVDLSDDNQEDDF